uniref:Ubiquinone biosynthesis protein COQ7 n=1 Tax=Corethron hystrix TaxID=216773 RepID=A0A7S1C0F0_9STRA
MHSMISTRILHVVLPFKKAPSKIWLGRLHSTSTAAAPSFDFEKIRNEILHRWMTEEALSPGGIQTRARYCCFTYDDAKRSYLHASARWHWLDRELSSNLAGETGATSIYRGARAAFGLRPPQRASGAEEFCREHMANEAVHLDLFRSVVPEGKHTRLLPVWRLAGWTLGFLPTLVGGPKALYVTVEAVETFVVEHFQEQIQELEKEQKCSELTRLLQYCCEDEAHHKEDAARHLLEDGSDLDSWWVKPWASIVRQGSIIAADVARNI